MMDDDNDVGPRINCSSTPSHMECTQVTFEMLDKLNVAQSTQANKEFLDSIGGVTGLAARLKLDLQKGLSEEQVVEYRNK